MVRRRDWLAQLQLTLAAFTLVFAVFGIGSLVYLLGANEVCTDVLGAAPVVAVPGLRDGATPGATVSVCTASPTVAQSVYASLVEGLWPLVSAVAAALLWRIVRDCRRADPFTASTVRRLRQLTVFVLLAGGVAAVAQMVAADALAATFVADGFHPSDTPVWAWLLVGLGLAAIAEIVNRGVALRAELDTVI